MKRREFTLAAAGLASTLAWPLTAGAQPRGYLELKVPVPTDAPAGQYEIIQFFSYGCVHCMNFEPILSAWAEQQPDDVIVRNEHVHFNQAFESLQKIYYALEAIDEVDKVHNQVFKGLQVDHKALDKPEVLFPWIAEHGIDRARFEAAYKSFGVATRVRRSIELQEAYRVEGTPALGILGRYYTDGSMARGFEAMLKLTEDLIAEARDRTA